MDIIDFHTHLIKPEKYNPATFRGTRMKYCDPIYLDDVAIDFPNLKIIMAHSGRGFWHDKCFFLSAAKL
jgi:predicted TIM-barrel fold metal-dependent hydrolase